MFDENVKYAESAFVFKLWPKTKKIRTAAIGVGSLGRHHARNYAELASEGRIDFIGACDVNAETLAQVCADNLFACSATGVNCWVGSMRFPLLRQQKLMPTLHAAFLEKGIHVLVEKPIAHHSSKLTR